MEGWKWKRGQNLLAAVTKQINENVLEVQTWPKKKKKSAGKGDINCIYRDGESLVERTIFGLGIEEVEFLYIEVLRLGIDTEFV